MKEEITYPLLIVVTKFCTRVQSFYLRTTLWNMEITSKLWDLNY